MISLLHLVPPPKKKGHLDAMHHLTQPFGTYASSPKVEAGWPSQVWVKLFIWFQKKVRQKNMLKWLQFDQGTRGFDEVAHTSCSKTVGFGFCLGNFAAPATKITVIFFCLGYCQMGSNPIFYQFFVETDHVSVWRGLIDTLQGSMGRLIFTCKFPTKIN